MRDAADVVIVGAGPAGLAAARAAARSGADVLVLERSREVGFPGHSGGGTWIADMARLGVEASYCNPIRVIRLASPHEDALFEYDDPMACVLDIRGALQRQAQLACDAGARLRLSAAYQHPILEDDEVTGCTAKADGGRLDITARAIVDATGFRAAVSRSLGLFGGFSRYGMGAEYDLNAPSWPSDECLFAMGSDVGLAGYGWVFPYGGRRARVGVGVIKPTSPERPLDLLNRFITEHRLLRGRLDVNSAIECHQGVVPSEPYAGPLGTGRMLVVGDAAGQVSAIAGEGIRFALEAGGLAGRLIGEASVAGASVADVVRTYQETWNRLHGKGLRLAHSINRRACEFDDASWDRWVRAASGLTPRTMASLLRGDFSVGLMLRVFSESPATAGSATLKTMLSRLRAGREQ